jgi:hypothetical protein
MGEILVARGEAPGKKNWKENRPRSIVNQGISISSDGMDIAIKKAVTIGIVMIKNRKSII